MNRENIRDAMAHKKRKMTKGPWTLTADQFSHIVVDVEGNEIYVGRDESIARLIAAVPDLLAALKRIQETGVFFGGIAQEMMEVAIFKAGEEK